MDLIKCDVKTPEDNRTVLVYGIPFRHVLGYYDHENKEWYWLNGENADFVIGDKITYWMPLPEPPEEEVQ